MLTLLSRAICHVKGSIKYAVLVCLSKLESRQKTRKQALWLRHSILVSELLSSTLLLKGESEYE